MLYRTKDCMKTEQAIYYNVVRCPTSTTNVCNVFLGDLLATLFEFNDQFCYMLYAMLQSNLQRNNNCSKNYTHITQNDRFFKRTL